jgi:hypothetical protein
MEDFNKYRKVIQSYLNIRDKISELNYNKPENNFVFTFFENLLSIGLYGNKTKNEFLNSIVIEEFTDKKFAYYNKIYEMQNGRKFYLKKTVSSPLNRSELVILDKNFYAIKTSERVKIIKGSIQNITYSGNNKSEEIKIYDIKRNHGFKGLLQEIICIDNDMYLLRDNSLILAKYNEEKFEFKILLEKFNILNMRELGKGIKKHSKNDEIDAVQFLLIQDKLIHLCEYSNNSGFSFLKKCIYCFTKDVPDYKIKCNSFMFNECICIINRENGIYLLDLFTFQINTFIESDCYYKNTIFKLNDYEILQGQSSIININDFTVERYNFGADGGTSICVIDNHYIYSLADYLEFVDIKTKKYFNIPFHLNNSSKIFNINEKEFGVFYEKRENGCTYIDIFEFIN